MVFVFGSSDQYILDQDLNDSEKHLFFLEWVFVKEKHVWAILGCLGNMYIAGRCLTVIYHYSGPYEYLCAEYVVNNTTSYIIQRNKSHPTPSHRISIQQNRSNSFYVCSKNVRPVLH